MVGDRPVVFPVSNFLVLLFEVLYQGIKSFVLFDVFILFNTTSMTVVQFK